MQKALSFIIRYIPQLLVSLLLVFTQLLFLNSNIIGVYLFTSLFTNKSYYKIFVTCCIVTVLYDSIKITHLGSWALSFFAVALIGEVIFNFLKFKNEINVTSLRGFLLLFIVIAISAIAQSRLLQWLTGQALAPQNESSIVVLTILVVILHRFTSNQKRSDYVYS